jgi:hypothetical protein
VPLPERAKAAVFAAVIVLSAIGLIEAAQAFRPEVPALSTGISLSMRIEGAGWTIVYASNDSQNNTAFQFLLEAGRALRFEVQWTSWSPPYSAVFVDAINGSRNGAGGRWWQFWVNGAYADTAADLTVLHNGDAVRWTFAPPEGG